MTKTCMLSRMVASIGLMFGCVPSGGGEPIKDAEVSGLCDPEVRAVFDRTLEPTCPRFADEIERHGLDDGNDPCLTNSVEVRFSDDGDLEGYLCGSIGFLAPALDGPGVRLYSRMPGLESIRCGEDGMPRYRLDSSWGCMTHVYVECGNEGMLADILTNGPDFFCHELEDYDPDLYTPSE